MDSMATKILVKLSRGFMDSHVRLVNYLNRFSGL
jgi:hypothetical protein